MPASTIHDNIEMDEARHELAFVVKARSPFGPEPRNHQHLDGDFGLVVPIIAAGQPDTAHAAAAQLQLQHIQTDAPADDLRLRGGRLILVVRWLHHVSQAGVMSAKVVL